MKHRARAVNCRSCGALIFWALTEAGKRMPVDLTPDEDGNLDVLPGAPLKVRVVPEADRAGKRLHHPHFETCPDADAHRRRR